MSRIRAMFEGAKEPQPAARPSGEQVALLRRDLETYGSGGESGLRFRLFRRSLRMFDTGRVIDLGAGHCKFTVEAHRLGWEATALDVRTERLGTLPEGVRFLEGDVSSDVWDPADYDVVCCFGLYYHLDQQMQHALLARVAGRPLILDTHVSTTDGSGYFQRIGRLSGLETLGSEQGRWFVEAVGKSAADRKENALLASFENERSWWPTMPSLLSTLREHGYSQVWVAEHDCPEAQRTFFVCFPD